MDAPGFPEGPESPTIKLILWALLVIVVVTSIAVTVIAARRGRNRPTIVGIGAALLLLAGIAYLQMLLPSYVFTSADGGGTCPVDAMDIAFMRGDRTSDFYA